MTWMNRENIIMTEEDSWKSYRTLTWTSGFDFMRTRSPFGGVALVLLWLVSWLAPSIISVSATYVLLGSGSAVCHNDRHIHTKQPATVCSVIAPT